MIKKNKLGQTDLNVSIIGLGTVKFGRNQGIKYPQSFDLPSDQEIIALLDLAFDFGVNLVDTAPAYGTSEERLGKAFQRYKREDIVISTKVGEDFIEGQSIFDFSPHHIQQSIERSLNRLRTDYLDIVLVHSDGNDLDLIEQHSVFDSLNDLKQKGVIRTIGMSTKTVEGGIKAIEQSDLAMVTYNPLECEEKPIIDKAIELNKGIFVKKAFASGHLYKISENNPIESSLKFILPTPGVTSLITGTINPMHLKQTLSITQKLFIS